MSTHFYHGCHFLHFHCSKYRSWCLFHLVPQCHCSPALEKKKKQKRGKQLRRCSCCRRHLPQQGLHTQTSQPVCPFQTRPGVPTLPQQAPRPPSSCRTGEVACWSTNLHDQTPTSRPPQPDLHHHHHPIPSTSCQAPAPFLLPNSSKGDGPEEIGWAQAENFISEPGRSAAETEPLIFF